MTPGAILNACLCAVLLVLVVWNMREAFRNNNIAFAFVAAFCAAAATFNGLGAAGLVGK